jgi:hypothetical protein
MQAACARAACIVIVATAAMLAEAQVCTFNTGQPGSVSFGVIDPSANTPAAFSVSIRFNCLLLPIPIFTITGQNDLAGIHRLKHATLLQYMPYSVSTVVTGGNTLTLNGQIAVIDFRNAYGGAYADSLTILVLP